MPTRYVAHHRGQLIAESTDYPISASPFPCIACVTPYVGAVGVFVTAFFLTTALDATAAGLETTVKSAGDSHGRRVGHAALGGGAGG
jgi:hypothetical protein